MPDVTRTREHVRLPTGGHCSHHRLLPPDRLGHSEQPRGNEDFGGHVQIPVGPVASGRDRASPRRIAARPAGTPVTDSDGRAEPVVVTMTWERVSDALLAHLARYVVLSRGEEDCRNIDLCASVATPGRVVVIEKWGSREAQRRHFDGDTMVALATAARSLGTERPVVDLLDGISAHDFA